MKKNLVALLCCTLFVCNFAACGNNQEAEVSSSSSVIADVESSLSSTPESESSTEASIEASAESTTSESIENTQNTESNEEEKERIIYRVELTNSGDKISAVSVEYRRLTNYNVTNSKENVESAPCIILVTTDKAEALRYKTTLEEHGATVTINEEAISLENTSAEAETTNNNATDNSEQTTNEGTVSSNFIIDNVYNITNGPIIFTGKVEQGTFNIHEKAVIVLKDGTEISAELNTIRTSDSDDSVKVAEEGTTVSLRFDDITDKEAILNAVSIVVKPE